MDKKAKKILFQTYWKNGWIDRKDRKIDPVDFSYAKEKALMFEPLTISHDECINQIIDISTKISIEQVIKAFLSSLSTHRLDWRSVISSLFIAKLFVSHKYTPIVSGHFYEDGKIVDTHYTCEVCRDVKYGVVGDQSYVNEDLSVLNFERIKWGGVRHGQLIYTLLDLELFVKEQIPEPTIEDIEILKEILTVIDSSKHGDYPSNLRDRIKDIQIFKSSKDERSMLLEALACIDVLQPASYDRPRSSKNDWTYVEFWRGEDRYNKKIVNQYFGEYLNDEY